MSKILLAAWLTLNCSACAGDDTIPYLYSEAGNSDPSGGPPSNNAGGQTTAKNPIWDAPYWTLKTSGPSIGWTFGPENPLCKPGNITWQDKSVPTLLLNSTAPLTLSARGFFKADLNKAIQSVKLEIQFYTYGEGLNSQDSQGYGDVKVDLFNDDEKKIGQASEVLKYSMATVSGSEMKTLTFTGLNEAIRGISLTPSTKPALGATCLRIISLRLCQQTGCPRS